jgi:hypothetical protein
MLLSCTVFTPSCVPSFGLCRDELALAEEEKQFISERAVHHKVLTACKLSVYCLCWCAAVLWLAALCALLQTEFLYFEICGFESVVFDCEQEGKRIHCEESSEIYKNELRVMNKR